MNSAFQSIKQQIYTKVIEFMLLAVVFEFWIISQGLKEFGQAS
jgi:hypothetical protein